MSTLRVANVHFDSTAYNRVDYAGNNIIRISSDGVLLPAGGNTGRPSALPGIIRYNTDIGQFEGYNASSWGAIGGVVDLAPANSFIGRVYDVTNVVFSVTNSAYTSSNTKLTFLKSYALN